MYGYPQYYQPMPDNLAQLRGQQPQQSSGLTWVQGEAGAKSFLLAPGQTVLLMDSEGDRFYLKSSDGSGMPMPLRVFEFKEITGAPKAAPVEVEYLTKQEFNEWVKQFKGDNNEQPV